MQVDVAIIGAGAAGMMCAAHAPGRVLLQADPHLFAPYRVHAGPKHYEVAPTYHVTSNRHRPRVLGYWQRKADG